MNPTDISNLRLINQQIAVSEHKTAKDVVAYMGAMQAQDFNMAKWAIGIRLPATTVKQIDAAINKYAIVNHPKFGKIYAFEVDGYGNYLMMDDSNVPSLLSLPYLGYLTEDNKIYQNTRKFALSEDNPYFYKGKAAEGIGGPHVGPDMIWPMAIIMRAMTTNDTKEIESCLRMLKNTHAGTGFMHETFNKDNPEVFSRSWFAWANTLFGELLIKIEKEHPELLDKMY